MQIQTFIGEEFYWCRERFWFSGTNIYPWVSTMEVIKFEQTAFFTCIMIMAIIYIWEELVKIPSPQCVRVAKCICKTTFDANCDLPSSLCYAMVSLVSDEKNPYLQKFRLKYNCFTQIRANLIFSVQIIVSLLWNQRKG